MVMAKTIPLSIILLFVGDVIYLASAILESLFSRVRCNTVVNILGVSRGFEQTAPPAEGAFANRRTPSPAYGGARFALLVPALLEPLIVLLCGNAAGGVFSSLPGPFSWLCPTAAAEF
jgi:hypothetical protein